MTKTTTNTILVIGSTGKTGKRVADQLENRGIPVRHGSRSADIPFDWQTSRRGLLRWPASTRSCHLLPGPRRPGLGRRDTCADRAGR